ncbi:MAG: hypothetical protein WA957_13310 [Alteraurantiacibacter sp.]
MAPVGNRPGPEGHLGRTHEWGTILQMRAQHREARHRLGALVEGKGKVGLPAHAAQPPRPLQDKGPAGMGTR